MSKRTQTTLTGWLTAKRRTSRNVRTFISERGNEVTRIDCPICLEQVVESGPPQMVKNRSCWSCKVVLCWHTCYQTLYWEAQDLRDFAEQAPNMAIGQCPMCRAYWRMLSFELTCLPLTNEEASEELRLRKVRKARVEESREMELELSDSSDWELEHQELVIVSDSDEDSETVDPTYTE